MATCPHCDRDLDADVAAVSPSNAGRKVTIEIDEDFLPAMAGVFSEMANRYGMYGYGILANRLNAMADPLFEALDRRLITFEPGPWAQAIHAHDKGLDMVFVLSEGHVIIGAYDGPDDEKGRVLAKGFVRKGDNADDVLALVKDIFARRTPKLKDADAAPEGPDHSLA